MMNRAKLVHVPRAVASVTDEKRLVLVGSATVLVAAKQVPLDMLNTNEIDAFAPDAPDEGMFSDLVEGSLGFGSVFFNTFGYAADGVSSKTASMPSDWRDRARSAPEVAPPGVEVIVPDIDDIALAKMVAWRDKDRDWLEAGVRSLILDPKAMAARLSRLPAATPLDELERRMAVVSAYATN